MVLLYVCMCVCIWLLTVWQAILGGFLSWCNVYLCRCHINMDIITSVCMLLCHYKVAETADRAIMPDVGKSLQSFLLESLKLPEVVSPTPGPPPATDSPVSSNQVQERTRGNNVIHQHQYCMVQNGEHWIERSILWSRPWTSVPTHKTPFILTIEFTKGMAWLITCIPQRTSFLISRKNPY